MIKEIKKQPASGYLALLVTLLGMAADVWWFTMSVRAEAVVSILLAVFTFIALFLLMIGLFVVNPNEARVLQLFGAYVGTVSGPGLKWANPFYTKRKVSTRIRNFETEKLKVNDLNSNPIEIAAVVVWRVIDTAEALFEVDDFEEYVHVQSESAVRGLATHYPYDAHEDDQKSLATNLDEIAGKLKIQIQDRLDKAGVEVLEARISHLAYSPEIANAMLQRQQASAIIAARKKIVDGAVGMVDMALERLAERNIVELDEERKATMVSNLLVVLCSDRATQPVVNTGSLYQ